MRVVLFCGGLGLRLRDYSDTIPKPMVKIGDQPIIWHLMKYYAHFGHRDFVLCLGHRAEVIKQYFLSYNKCFSHDFVLSEGGAQIELLDADLSDWRMTFADTGIVTNIGGRLRAVRKYVEREDVFLANYTDNLTDADLGVIEELFLRSDAVAGFLCVQPNFSFHLVTVGDANQVVDFRSAHTSSLWSNGGFFIFRQSIFDYLHEGEELVEEPFQRLIQEGRLVAFRHEGFWACMDTFKEKQQLEELYVGGRAPWERWKG